MSRVVESCCFSLIGHVHLSPTLQTSFPALPHPLPHPKPKPVEQMCLDGGGGVVIERRPRNRGNSVLLKTSDPNEGRPPHPER
jgi:hypothetical protein